MRTIYIYTLLYSLLILFTPFVFGSMRSPKSFVLSNNLQVLLLKDQNLPYVKIHLMVPMGSTVDPEGLEGLSSMVSQSLSRGTEKRSAEEISSELENLGTQFSFRTSKDYSLYSVDGLYWNYETLMEIFSDIIMNPTFMPKEVSLIQKRLLSQMNKRPESAQSFAAQAISDILYTLSSQKSYSHPGFGYKKSIKKITPKDLSSHFKRHLDPSRSYLAITGKYPKDIKKQLEKIFAKWTPVSSDLPKEVKNSRYSKILQFLKQKDNKKPSYVIIHKKGQAQSNSILGLPSLSRSSKDYLPLKLAHNVLGEGSSSILSSELREKRGLTYGIYSKLAPLKRDGISFIYTNTRLDVTKEAIDYTIRELKRFHRKGINLEQFKKAKQLYKVGVLQSHEKVESQSFTRIFYKFYNLFYDLDNLDKILSKVSLEQVNQAIKKYFDPQNPSFVIVVFTDKTKVQNQFKGVKNIRYFDYTQFL